MLTETEIHIATQLIESGDRAAHVTLIGLDNSIVEFDLVANSDSYQYMSRREDERSYTRAPNPMSLSVCWHHAMVFFGIIPPDGVSHPSD